MSAVENVLERGMARLLEQETAQALAAGEARVLAVKER
jgi:hypothetical protein